MSDDQFTKLFKYMQEFREDVDKRFDEQDKKIDDIYGAIDGLAKLITEYHQEMVMLTR